MLTRNDLLNKVAQFIHDDEVRDQLPIESVEQLLTFEEAKIRSFIDYVTNW